MSTLGATQPTLLDVSKRFSADGKPLPLAELLHKTNEILDDIPWMEANGTNGHKMSARAGLPTASFRKLNKGVAASKSEYQDVTESLGMLSSLGIVDRKLVQLAPDQAKFRMDENIGHIEAMSQAFATALLYGDTDLDPEKFLGLSPRFDDLSGPNNAEQIIDAGGTGSDNCSIWLVGWGEQGVMGIYPRGSKAGLVHEDKGEELVSDGAGGQYPALRDWFEWDCGIAVKDWRNIVRIANVDVSELTKTGSTGADLQDLMIQAVEQMNNASGLRPVFYVPRKIRTFLRRQILQKSNLFLGISEIAGRKVVDFDGIPVRRVDALTEAESRIT